MDGDLEREDAKPSATFALTVPYKMNWRLVAALSAVGLALMVASWFRLLSNLDTLVWLLYGVAVVGFVAWRTPSRAFLHGAAVGGLLVTVGVAATLLVLPYLVRINLEAAQLMVQLGREPGSIRRGWDWVSAPLFGTAGSVFFGILSWVASLIVRIFHRIPAG